VRFDVDHILFRRSAGHGTKPDAFGRNIAESFEQIRDRSHFGDTAEYLGHGGLLMRVSSGHYTILAPHPEQFSLLQGFYHYKFAALVALRENLCGGISRIPCLTLQGKPEP
jgi:hypothetical protein